MRTKRERGARIELAITAPRKAREVAPQQTVIPGPGYRLVLGIFTTETQRIFDGQQYLLLGNVVVKFE
ncbi:MAG: hypothetical protein JO139_00350 [Alphaproteobacteria bacterium]|nr:hypothetical protein [Alphaproteobacteria bacterium]